METLRMIDVSPKKVTARRAVARGSLKMTRQAFARLKGGTLPKGDPLPMAQVAGVSAAKRVSEALPLCHPLPLDQVRVWFELDPELPGVHAFCEARATAKTGVEMEALAGVSGALLAVWDVVKGVEPALEISEVRLELKEGGKSGLWRHPSAAAAWPPRAPTAMMRAGRRERRTAAPPARASAVPALGRASVVTVSDRCSRGEAEDTAGPTLAAGLKAIGLKAGAPVVIPDDRALIEATIKRLAASSDVVALTGGTGLGPRDVTPEAVAAVCERLIPGVGEALRASGSRSTPHSHLSRSVAGQLGRALVVALPGSRGGVSEGLEVLSALLPHALHVLRGGSHESRRDGRRAARRGRR